MTDEKNVEAEKQSGPETTEIKDSPVSETEEKKEEPEDKVIASSIYDKCCMNGWNLFYLLLHLVIYGILGFCLTCRVSI